MNGGSWCISWLLCVLYRILHWALQRNFWDLNVNINYQILLYIFTHMHARTEWEKKCQIWADRLSNRQKMTNVQRDFYKPEKGTTTSSGSHVYPMSTYQFTTPTLKYYPYFWSTTAINTSDCSPLDLPPHPTTPSHTTVPPGHLVMTENYPGLPQERSPCRHCNGPRKWGRCLFAGGREIFTKEFSVPNSNCPAVCFLLHLFCISGMSRCRQNEKKQSQDVKRIDCTFKDGIFTMDFVWQMEIVRLKRLMD